MAFIRRFVALCIVLVVSWSLYIYGLGSIQSASLLDVVSTEKSLAEVPIYLSTDALLVVAEQQVLAGISEELALRALSSDPVNGGAAAFLLALYAMEGRDEEASSVVDLSARLWPVHTYTHSRIADYWLAKGRVDRLIPELNLLLIREPGWRKDIFPLLEALTINAGKISLLAPYINQPPNWWDSFFSSISKHLDKNIVSDIYKRRVASSSSVSEVERNSFVKRLIRDKQWNEASKQWLGGLDSSQSSLMSNGLFDGGFESNMLNSEFGWVVKRNKGFGIAVSSTYGVSGKKALQVSFRAGLNRIAFKHVSQKLLLQPGSYELSYKVRADALKNPKGLVWRIRCESSKDELLGEGKPMIGRHQWQIQSFSLTVPRSCEVQSLGLEAVSKYPHEHIFNGKLWLDDVVIEPKLGTANQ